jgi:hypothetical protein
VASAWFGDDRPALYAAVTSRDLLGDTLAISDEQAAADGDEVRSLSCQPARSSGLARDSGGFAAGIQDRSRHRP